jgi:phenylpyruvate tautomerase PptA (4-oxalocrotonate tautomerase family)
MPIIQCDIRRGRTTEQKANLAKALTYDVHEVTGIPIDFISVYIRELPGLDTFEAGEPSPEYQPGPDGQDVAGQNEIRRRQTSQGGSD